MAKGQDGHREDEVGVLRCGLDVDHSIMCLRSGEIDGVLEECISSNQKICHFSSQSEMGLGLPSAPLYGRILMRVPAAG